MLGGRPGRGSSASPSSRSARKRRRHLRTVSAVARSSWVTATIADASGPAHASTIRARRASAWVDVALRVHRSNTACSSTESSNGSSLPRRGADAPAIEVTQLLRINYWRRTSVVNRPRAEQSLSERGRRTALHSLRPGASAIGRPRLFRRCSPPGSRCFGQAGQQTVGDVVSAAHFEQCVAPISTVGGAGWSC